jgi:hypothetical protein
MLDVAGIADIAAARAASHDCPYCTGFGLATVFRAGYAGEAVVDEIGANGQQFRRLMMTPAYCICTAGRWLLVNHQADAKDIFARMNDLYDILDSRKGSLWAVNDPTMPYFDPGEVPDWAAFRRMIAAGPAIAKSARAVLREPAKIKDWKSLPPTPNHPATPPPVAAAVPVDDSFGEPPF